MSLWSLESELVSPGTWENEHRKHPTSMMSDSPNPEPSPVSASHVFPPVIPSEEDTLRSLERTSHHSQSCAISEERVNLLLRMGLTEEECSQCHSLPV